MSRAVRGLYLAALSEYAIANGEDPPTSYICVPHQFPPMVKDSDWYPPDLEAGDQYVQGDHDYHTVMPLADGLTYGRYENRHQYPKVYALACRELSKLLPNHWMESVLCSMYQGHSMLDPDFRMLCDDLTWDLVWPEVDADLNLTGKIVEDTDGYVNVDDDAMMSESDAEKAGLVVVDGRVHIPGGKG